MLIEHNREKIINAIIYFVTNTKFCGITKLCKLMYYLDFLHFKETGRSVTGMDYDAWNFGPVPTTLYDEISNLKLKPDLRESISIRTINNFTVMKARKPFNGLHFTKREKRILEKVAFIFEEAKTEDIVEASHLPNHPWYETIENKGFKAKIDYMLALDGSGESISKEEALERISDREEMKRVFSG
ncbi:Panacea domain-containing protein [Candidatus Magnetominusculus dajiuhuensis]|uniref:Panacea domain-containing protein n=1 Tax=Candidatus Magnetominusculus dajiuhuensis TaxID=3137712 RepID=UPI003B42B9B7